MRRIVLLLSLVVIMFHSCWANNRYFICGPDEDGCPEDNEHYCFCIPYDEQYANQPHCLDLVHLRCMPYQPHASCNIHLIYRNQSECLATIFQSEPIPACKITNLLHCQQVKAHVCNKYGQLTSCT
ncbi:MAG: hypothetical protein ACOVQX_05955 [Legionella sp.]